MRTVCAVAEEQPAVGPEHGRVLFKGGDIAVVIGRRNYHAGYADVVDDEPLDQPGVGGKEHAFELFALHYHGFDAQYAAGIEHALVAVAGDDELVAEARSNVYARHHARRRAVGGDERLFCADYLGNVVLRGGDHARRALEVVRKGQLGYILFGNGKAAAKGARRLVPWHVKAVPVDEGVLIELGEYVIFIHLFW